MSKWSYLNDKSFLKSLDDYSNKKFRVRIEVYNLDDVFLKNIEGEVQPGSSISLNGSSSVRRTCNLTLIATEENNDLTNIENILSPNKKIKIFEGIENKVSGNYDDMIWFPLGVFIIIQPNISHTNAGCLISLTCKDKMCLLNGECAGGLPTSIIFHEYDQKIGKREVAGDPALIIIDPNDYTVYHDSINNKYYKWSKEYSWKELTKSEAEKLVGSITSRPQKVYDIIQTLVQNYGGESLNRIFINDVPLEIKQIVRYTGSGLIYYNSSTQVYTLDESELLNEGEWKTFNYNEDVGYVYTDFTYPGTLISSIGDNVCSVLDKIKNALGNYEYFYDVEGNFIFQEIKNYLNNSYDPTNVYRLDNGRRVEIPATNNLVILDDECYEVDFYSNTKSVYTFNEGSGLITSYNNAPNYSNIKNDYHIWGEKSDTKQPIHYHLAIKDKPAVMNTYQVVFLKDDNGEYTGGLRLANDSDKTEDIKPYIPSDWRAELYLRGLVKQKNQQRPDIYEQELLDLFDSIYNFYEAQTDKDGKVIKDSNGEIIRGKFKADLTSNPNNLLYFIDYLEPVSKIYDYSVDVLSPKIYSYQQNKIRRLYNADVPNVILLDVSMDPDEYAKRVLQCTEQGQAFANVDHSVYSKIAIGTVGYTAQEVARDLIYQYTNFNESITITSVPIYYLDVNSRITVQDKKSHIFGDYIIHNITLPLDAGGTMSISASRALERI